MKRKALIILFTKLFSPTVRNNCTSDQEKLLQFEAEVREFLKQNASLTYTWRFLRSNICNKKIQTGKSKLILNRFILCT